MNNNLFLEKGATNQTELVDSTFPKDYLGWILMFYIIGNMIVLFRGQMILLGMVLVFCVFLIKIKHRSEEHTSELQSH